MSPQQTLQNHTRFHPPFHFFVAPVLLLNVIVVIVLAIRYWPLFHWLGVWAVLVAVALLVCGGLARVYSLQNQDRIIRLEERLRYPSLLSPAELTATQTLTPRQIIALRFASDAELPALALRAAAEGLNATQIKQSIRVWRPDTSRV